MKSFVFIMLSCLLVVACGGDGNNADIELCGNNIDDDGDGLTDCDDDDCDDDVLCNCIPTTCEALGYECGTWPAADGCGTDLVCGDCEPGLVCGNDGQCETSCVPETCEDLNYECGDWPAADGCGGDLTCGSCGPDQICNADGQCETTCVADCLDKECGDDGCGGSCGGCTGDETCEDGICTQEASSPVIIDLSSNTAIMNEDSELVISAVVTDPQGIADLIGGSLKNESQTLSYGAFSTSGEEGSYQITLNWNNLDTVEPIWTERTGRERIFTALFYDQAGHRTSANISVLLRCTEDRAACDGECLENLDICDGGDTCTEVGGDPANCGACGFSCPAVSNGNLICAAGLCDVDCYEGYAHCGATDCREALNDDSNCGGCDQSCEAAEDCLFGNCIDDNLTVITISGTTFAYGYAGEELYFVIQVQTPSHLEVEWEDWGYVCNCDYSLWVVDDISWSFVDSEYYWSNECTQWGYSGDLSPGTYIYHMSGCDSGIASVNFHLTPIAR